jgi:light-regulated signal transduction histidine kinase (bacteriophytochrome)
VTDAQEFIDIVEAAGCSLSVEGDFIVMREHPATELVLAMARLNKREIKKVIALLNKKGE